MKRGFSLVELSIVLVILGLLVGGVLSGQSLIHAAEIRSIPVAYQKYYTATQSFRDKYFALPGDMTNATSFWGIAGGTTGNDTACYNTLSTDQKTCNGDGDGNFSPITATQSSDGQRYWQHLANAGLIEGQYTGTGTNPTNRVNGSVPGVNAPILKMSGTTFEMMNLTRTASLLALDWYEANFTYGYYFGSVICTTGCGPIEAALTPEDAWNIDTKMDDGSPSHGKIETYRKGSTGTPGSANCANSAVTATAAYDLTNPTKVCALQFGF